MNPKIRFHAGEYPLHENPNFNYQLNRTYNVSNGDLQEMKDLGGRIQGISDWETEMLSLAEKALSEGRIEPAVAYFRMAEFFMFDGNPQKLPTYEKSRELFYQFHSQWFRSGVLSLDSVPYETGFLPVIHAKPEGQSKGSILLHGGYDSYMEEFFYSALYMREAGYDVYLFEGPGQGAVLRRQKITFTYKWELPVKALLDHYGLDRVTIIGISLGSILAPRAAAFEKRIDKAVAWSVGTSLLDLFFAVTPPNVRGALEAYMKEEKAEELNALVDKLMEASSLLDWSLHHGMYNMGVKTPYEFLLAARNFQYRDVAGNISQDVLVLGAEKDHLIPIQCYKEVIDGLKNVKSLTYRLFTDKEHAASHCSTGNPKLVLDTILSWIALMDGRII